MAIFLDSNNLSEIERFHRMGIIRGVTTNPTIMLKDGVTGGVSGIEAQAKSIARLIAPGLGGGDHQRPRSDDSTGRDLRFLGRQHHREDHHPRPLGRDGECRGHPRTADRSRCPR